MGNHNKSDIVEIYGWRLIMWEYYKTSGKYEKDPKEIGAFNQEFIGDTFNQLSNEEKKIRLKFMFDRFYEDICQQMGLNTIFDYKTTQKELEKNVHLSNEDMSFLNR